MAGPFVAVARFLTTRTSGPAALRVALPLYFGVGIAATLIFAHSGLEASTVVARAEGAATTRSLLLAAWTLATLPAIRRMLTTEPNAFLRSLPIPRWHILACLALLMALAELPWAALWARGGGVVSGLGATLIALAVHACLVARIRGRSDIVLIATACAAWIAGAPFARGRVVAGSVVFALALSRAWQRAPELSASGYGRRMSGPPAFALANAYGLVLARRHAAVLWRAAGGGAVAMAWAGLTVLNEPVPAIEASTIPRVLLATWIPSNILAAAMPLGPVLRAEMASEWLFATCGVTVVQRRAGTLGLLGTAGAAAGLLTGALLGIALHRSWMTSVAWALRLALAAAVLSGLTEVCGRWAIREQGRDGGRLVLALGLLMALAEGALWFSSP